jgi:hypothetical protein
MFLKYSLRELAKGLKGKYERGGWGIGIRRKSNVWSATAARPRKRDTLPKSA